MVTSPLLILRSGNWSAVIRLEGLSPRSMCFVVSVPQRFVGPPGINRNHRLRSISATLMIKRGGDTSPFFTDLGYDSNLLNHVTISITATAIVIVSEEYLGLIVADTGA